MENEVPMSQPPMTQAEPQYQEPTAPVYPDIEALKAQARDLAVQQVLVNRAAVISASASQPSAQPTPSFVQLQQQQTPPKVIYLRRNLTVAELIVVFAVACGVVSGIPALWNFAANRLPQIEIKVK
jgi:hypothetical protein